MPPRGVKKGTKRARQYEHIKESGKRSGGPGGRTREQLYNDAKKLGIDGRSKMSGRR